MSLTRLASWVAAPHQSYRSNTFIKLMSVVSNGQRERLTVAKFNIASLQCLTLVGSVQSKSLIVETPSEFRDFISFIGLELMVALMRW